MSLPGRVPLGILPTPLVRARRLEEVLGCPPLYVKRDDLVGFSVAGNKARKLEYLLADARARGGDVLVTGGGPGSNHVAATAAAAAVADLECRVVVAGHASATHPNLALVRRFGAAVSFTGDEDRASVDPGIDRVAAELAADGRRPYAIPRGGATPLGAAAFAAAAREVEEQLDALGVAPRAVLVATGSGGTQAGLVAGAVAAGRRWRVVGASVSRPVPEIRDRVLALARGCAELTGGPTPEPGDADVRDARGPGFAIPSPAGDEATRAADRAGLLLDPVYTAKALALLPELAADGLDGPVLFWHTGGLPAALRHVPAAPSSSAQAPRHVPAAPSSAPAAPDPAAAGAAETRPPAEETRR